MAAKNHCTQCDRFSFFELPEGVCQRCATEAKRMAELKAEYQGRNWNAMDLIQLYWRSNFSVSQVAEILDESVDTIAYHIEICRQNAR